MKASLFCLLCLFLMRNFQEENYSEFNKVIEFREEPESVFVDRKKEQLSNDRGSSQLKEGLDNVSGKMFLAKFKTVHLAWEKESENKRIETSVNLLAIDQMEFDVSGIEIIHGSHSEALNEAYNVLISREFAYSYFGESNPVNKILILENKYSVLIKGVFNSNSIGLRYDLITNTQTFNKIDRSIG